MTEPRSQVVLCGLGGQGVLFLTRLLAEAAVLEGREVLSAETHGMAQRGGAVESHVKIGSFSSPVVRRGRADAVLVLDQSRLETARGFLRPGGECFLGAPDAVADARACAAARLADELGYPGAANLVLLGFASASAPQLFPAQAALLRALDALSPAGARAENRRAFERGAAAAHSPSDGTAGAQPTRES